jgi:acetyl-CoA synthetase
VEAAVVGVPEETKGTVPIAFVTLRSSSDDGVADRIRALVAGEMGGYARPDRVYVTPAMPKTRTGKTMRRLLRDVVVHGGPTGDTSAMEDPAALEAVTEVVRG